MRLASADLTITTGNEVFTLMQRSIQPVSLGMGAGALIALIHQLVVLQTAGVIVDNVRRRARTWVDKIIAQYQGILTQQQTSQVKPNSTIEEAQLEIFKRIESFVEARFSSIADLHVTISTGLTDVRARVNEQANQAEDFANELESAREKIRGASQTSDTLQSEMETSTLQLGRIVEKVDSVIETELLKFSESFGSASRLLVSLVESMNQSVQRVEHQSTAFVEAGSQLVESGATFATSCRIYAETMQASADQHSSVLSEVNQLSSTVSQLNEPMRQSVTALIDAQKNLTSGGVILSESQNQFRSSVTLFSKVVNEVLVPTCDEHQKLISASSVALERSADAAVLATQSWQTVESEYNRIQAENSRLNQATSQLADATSQLQSTLTSSEQVVAELHSTIQPAIERLSVTHESADAVLAALQVDFTPLAPAINEFSVATNQLAGIAAELRPLADASHDFKDTVRRLEKLLRDVPSELKPAARSRTRTRTGRFLEWLGVSRRSAEKLSSNHRPPKKG